MKRKFKDLINLMKKFWKFMWYDDSVLSYILAFFFAFLFVKFIFFPSLGFVLGSDYPVVAIVSGSMEHKIVNSNICGNSVFDTNSKKLNFDEYWVLCGSYYESRYNITKSEFENYEYKNGLNIGDVMVLRGKDFDKIEKGDILIFIPNDRTFFNNFGPLIHRVVHKWQDEEGNYHFQTKGDNNAHMIESYEKDIPQEDVLGVALIRIPWLGYPKILLNKVFGFL